MEYATGSLAYALSNPSMLLCSCLKASLDVRYLNILIYQIFQHDHINFIVKMFDEIGMAYLRKRSVLLTGYLEVLLDRNLDKGNSSFVFPRNYQKLNFLHRSFSRMN